MTGWFHPYNLGSQQIIFDIGDAYMLFNGGRIRINHSGGYDDANTTSSWTVNKWHHLTLSYDGTTARGYINGIERLTAVEPIVLDGNIGMGCIYTPGLEFEGIMDDIRFYNRTLSDNEIYTLAHCRNSGDWFYNENEDVMQFCDDTNSPVNMAPAASGAGGCITPTHPEGTLYYDTDRYKYCDGVGWVDIGK